MKPRMTKPDWVRLFGRLLAYALAAVMGVIVILSAACVVLLLLNAVNYLFLML